MPYLHHTQQELARLDAADSGVSELDRRLVELVREGATNRAISGAAYRSNVDRDPGHLTILRERGERIQVFELQGYLFFGTASSLLDRIKEIDGVAAVRRTVTLAMAVFPATSVAWATMTLSPPLKGTMQVNVVLAMDAGLPLQVTPARPESPSLVVPVTITWATSNSAPSDGDVMATLGAGSLLSSMMLTATTICLIDRRLAAAAGWALASSVLTFFGFMHAERLGLAVAGPAVLGYLLMGLLFLGMVPLRQPAAADAAEPAEDAACS